MNDVTRAEKHSDVAISSCRGDLNYQGSRGSSDDYGPIVDLFGCVGCGTRFHRLNGGTIQVIGRDMSHAPESPHANGEPQGHRQRFTGVTPRPWKAGKDPALIVADLPPVGQTEEMDGGPLVCGGMREIDRDLVLALSKLPPLVIDVLGDLVAHVQTQRFSRTGVVAMSNATLFALEDNLLRKAQAVLGEAFRLA